MHEQTKNSHMFRDKEMPCEFKSKRKEIRMCETSHFTMFCWSYLTGLLTCEVHDIPHLPSGLLIQKLFLLNCYVYCKESQKSLLAQSILL